MNRFLQTRQEVDECTQWLKDNGLISHSFPCKDFDIYNVAKVLKDGNILDMGSNGSFILQNALTKGIQGRKCGIDLGNPEYTIEGIEYIKGDLMNTPYEDGSFDVITCLSVVEHEVDYNLLAMECNRLLVPGGSVYLTFDYWDPKVDTTGILLYGLKWNILNSTDVAWLLKCFNDNGLKMTGEMNWETKETVINPQFCAPYGKNYTFGLIELIKHDTANV